MTAKIFDPDGVGVRNGNYFGMPFVPDNAPLVLVSVPWDVTSSYGAGSAGAPDAIIEESTQLDFHDPWASGEWQKGIATTPIDYGILERSERLREDARKVMENLEAGGDGSACVRKSERVNAASGELDREVYVAVKDLIDKGKTVGIVGGDHSVPLGAIKAIAEREKNIGILHLDAHLDLREAYEGFESSHASIMFNVLRDVPQVEKIVQVGARDFSRAEFEFAKNDPRIKLFTGPELAENEFNGVSWAQQCEKIVNELPERVYVSFDVDFLSPEFCPSTGTPVPGGCSFDQAVYLVRRVVDSGRRIVGFDLCEVTPKTVFDASVGARILWKLCGQTLRGI